MRALWITEEPPDRAMGGGNIRQAHLLTALGHAAPTDLLLAGRLEDDETRRALRRVVEVEAPASGRPSRRWQRRVLDLWVALASRGTWETLDMAPARRALKRELDRLGGTYDVVVNNHQGLMPLLPGRRRGRWVAHLHNVSAQRTRQLAATATGRQRWLFEQQARRAERFEERTVARYDAVLVCSDEDADALCGADRSRARGPVLVAPNGVDVDRFVAGPIPNQPMVAFTGTLDYLPNVDGALWFAREVLPEIRRRCPSAELSIVGRRPAPEVRALDDLPGVSLHADVPAVAPYLSNARVIVVPLRMGTGTRLKALEALAAGRPLVGTRTGLAGLGIVDGIHGRVVDDVGGMAAAVVELLRDDGRAAALAAAGRAFVEEHYRWERIGEAFVRDLRAIVSG